MVSVNTNIASIGARNNLVGNNGMQEKAFERLSSGQRINSASDDAAGLQIANSMTSQINGLKMASKNASDGISLVNTVDGALSESTEILQRMRELAVQSISDTNSGQDRVFIQDEINALNTELNRIASTTQFNGMNLLDGSFSNVELQVGADVGQKVIFGVNNADNATLGSFQLTSTVETVGTEATNSAGALTQAGNDSHASAKSALDALYNSAADYTLSGSFGTKTASVNAGADARDVAAAFNSVSNTTGVTATAITRTRIEHITGADTFTMTLQGKSTTSSTVTFTISDVDDISAAKDAINAVSGSTGIIAKMVDGDKSKIDLVQEEGYDIIVGDVTASSTNTAITCDGTAISAGASATVTAGAAHGLKVGDIVTYTAAGTTVTNLTTTAEYRVDTVASTTTFTLSTTDGSVHTYGGGGNSADTFTKLNGIQFKVRTASNTDGTLSDGNTVTLNSANDSTAFVGQITLNSHKNFTVASGNAANHFATDTSAQTTDLNTVGSIDMKTVIGSSRALSIIDSALQMIDQSRSQMGALNNRLESTVDNLSNITVKTEASLARIMDADFAKETTELSKSQVLSQAATAMLAQANQQPQNVLRLLQAG